MTSKKKYLYGLIALLSTIICVFTIDQPLAQFFSPSKFETFWLINRKITDLGEGSIYFAIAIIVLLGSTFYKNLKNRQFYKVWSAQFLISLILSGVLTHVFKFLIGRQRPHRSPNFDPFIVEPFNTHWNFHSMPSGHSQTVFIALIAALALLKEKNIYYRYLVIVAFVYVGLTRALIQAHFISDVIMGATLGLLVSITVFESEKIRKRLQSYA